MQLTTLITAAGLAVATANAFLIPGDIPLSEEETISILPAPVEAEFAAPVLAFGDELKLKLKCPGCPVKQFKNGVGAIKTDVPSHLRLDFSIKALEDGSDALMVNNYLLYSTNKIDIEHLLTAPLIPEHHTPHKPKGPRPGDRKIHKPAVLGFGLSVQPVPTSPEDKMDLISLNLNIFEVNNVLVNKIPGINILLIHTPDNKFLIASITTTDSGATETGSAPSPDCTGMMCEWKNLVDKFANFRPFKSCGGGKPPGNIVGDADEGFYSHGHGHGHGHGHHRGNSWVRLLKNIGSHIVLPIVIGIVAGVSASILGMMVGTLVVYLWRTFVRGPSTRCHRAGLSCNKASLKEAAVNDEKLGLMAQQDEEEADAPPAYADESTAPQDIKTSENES